MQLPAAHLQAKWCNLCYCWRGAGIAGPVPHLEHPTQPPDNTHPQLSLESLQSHTKPRTPQCEGRRETQQSGRESGRRGRCRAPCTWKQLKSHPDSLSVSITNNARFWRLAHVFAFQLCHLSEKNPVMLKDVVPQSRKLGYTSSHENLVLHTWKSLACFYKSASIFADSLKVVQRTRRTR